MRNYSPSNDLIIGKHAVFEALEAGVKISEIYIRDSKDLAKDDFSQLKRLAEENAITISNIKPNKMDLLANGERHGGVIAKSSGFYYSSVEDILNVAKSRNEEPFIVFVDGITDPHNFGAIIRSAYCAGAHGIIIKNDRACGVTPAAAKVSAGACYHIAIAKVVNLTREIERLKSAGIWFMCLSPDGPSIYKTNLRGGIALVVGAEGTGVSRLVSEHCDLKVGIPLKGTLGSLNASVAFGIAAFEVVRQGMS